MEQTITVNISWHGTNRPADAFVTLAGDNGQPRWLADTAFGPFDDAMDVARWARRQVTLAIEGQQP